MGVSEGGGKIESIQKVMVLARGVISREGEGSESWYKVLIVKEVLVYWSKLVSLLGVGGVGF